MKFNSYECARDWDKNAATQENARWVAAAICNVVNLVIMCAPWNMAAEPVILVLP